MAHAVENMFSVGQVPWHGLGSILDSPPSMEEAIQAAGLDWKVKLAPLCLQKDARPVDHRACVRDSDGTILGVVGPDFRPLQNADAFAWFQPFVDSGSVTLEAAGSLHEGRKVWVLAKTANGTADIVKGDAVEQYVLLAHAHDGSLAIRVGFTNVRVVCQNTLSASLSDGRSKLLKVRHTKNAKDALALVRDTMDTAQADFRATTETMRALAKKGCSEATLKRYVREVFEEGSADDETSSARLVNRIVPLFEGGRGSELSRGTMWGAFNAVTEYTSHERGRSADSRVDSQWFGEGARIAQRALDVAVEYVGLPAAGRAR